MWVYLYDMELYKNLKFRTSFLCKDLYYKIFQLPSGSFGFQHADGQADMHAVSYVRA
jgi:hypothetical protein